MSELISGTMAKRLRIYISEGDRWQGKPLDGALLEVLRSKRLAGATVFRAAAGFGAHSRIHNAGIEVLSLDLPIVIEVIDAVERIDAILEVISPMIREGLITVDTVEIVKYTHRFLNPLPADRPVSEVMTRGVIALKQDMKIGQAWHLMLEKAVKAAPVVDEGNKVVGILTDEDLLERAGVQQRLSVSIRMDREEISQDLKLLDGSPMLVKEVMTRPVVTVAETDTLGNATARMVKMKLKRLPVVDSRGRLAGMLSRLDILRQVAESSIAIEAHKLPEGTVTSVKDVMTSTIPMVNQDDDLARIIDQFARFETHRLIVVDHLGKAIGLISDSDVVARVQPARQRTILDAFKRLGKPHPGKETAYDLMSPGPLTGSPDLPVVEAISLMIKQSRKWLVVVDDEGKPLGLVDRQIALEAIIR